MNSREVFTDNISAMQEIPKINDINIKNLIDKFIYELEIEPFRVI